ncbi:MAG: hypothetical protein WA940_00240 [Sphingopyxis sp.]
MAETEPLLFRSTLGTLRPLNGAAADALKAIPANSTVRVEIKRTVGNTRRMAWYWVMLKLTLDNLADAFDGPMTTKALHRWLKREYGLAVPIRSHKTGEIIDWDYDSISFAAMPENERSAFVDWATETLSRRLGVDGSTLRTEAEAAA